MHPPIRTNADARALEKTPLAELLPADNAFDAVRLAAERHPDNIALKLLPPGDPMGDAREISFRDFMAGCFRMANALHTLGLRPGETVSFLLPLCAEAYYIVVGGEAAGPHLTREMHKTVPRTFCFKQQMKQ